MYNKFYLLIFSLFSMVLAAQGQVNIVPKPTQLKVSEGLFSLPKQVKVYVDRNSKIDLTYFDYILVEMGLKAKWVSRQTDGDVIFLLTGSKLDVKDESYKLETATGRKKAQIIASANSRNGLLHALQTLRQLGVDNGKGALDFPVCSISDKPAFGWRAYMLDESRYFHGKTMVKSLLDEMARIKLNTFHWHLVDDPAWRIEIKKYPLLTEIASKGNFGHMVKFQETGQVRWDSIFVNPPAQFYTQDDIREIVSYADARGIMVIPEIEVPGHVSASVYAYPWLGATSKSIGKGVHGDLYDVTDPKVEKFVHDVLDEIYELFPSGIIHIGGDEANYEHWKNSKGINDFMKKNIIPTYADLQIWAINRMSKYISSKGYRMIGWNEITGDNIRGEEHVEASKSEKLADQTIVQFWDGAVSLINSAIDKGYEVVNSDRQYTYLDYSYEATSFEKAYSFNPIPNGIAEKDKKKILGLGCQMWGEYTPDSDRINYQTFPRIAAFAEIGWVPAESKSSYEEFRKRFEKIERIWIEKGYIHSQKEKY